MAIVWNKYSNVDDAFKDIMYDWFIKTDGENVSISSIESITFDDPGDTPLWKEKTLRLRIRNLKTKDSITIWISSYQLNRYEFCKSGPETAYWNPKPCYCSGYSLLTKGHDDYCPFGLSRKNK
jgi:hypothetical protein